MERFHGVMILVEDKSQTQKSREFYEEYGKTSDSEKYSKASHRRLGQGGGWATGIRATGIGSCGFRAMVGNKPGNSGQRILVGQLREQKMCQNMLKYTKIYQNMQNMVQNSSEYTKLCNI